MADIPRRYRDQVLAKTNAGLGRLEGDVDRVADIEAGHGRLCDRESDLQRDVELWLEGAGYWRRTASAIADGPPPLGWQIHIHAAQKNPLLLDLLLIANDGSWLELELKTRPASRVADHQRDLINQDRVRRRICYSVGAVAKVVAGAVAASQADFVAATAAALEALEELGEALGALKAVRDE